MYSYTLSLTLALDTVGGERHAPTALPLGRDPVTTVYEPGWTAGPFWRGAENLAPPGFDPCTVLIIIIIIIIVVVIIVIIIIIIINSNKQEWSQRRKYDEMICHSL